MTTDKRIIFTTSGLARALELCEEANQQVERTLVERDSATSKLHKRTSALERILDALTHKTAVGPTGAEQIAREALSDE